MKPLIFILIILFGLSCSKKVVYNKIKSEEDLNEIVSRSSDRKEACDCLKTSSYEPREEWNVIEDPKVINLVFHFPNTTNFKNNFIGQDAFDYAKSLTKHSNIKLGKNKKMRLPAGNNTPIYNIPWRYKQLEVSNSPNGKAVYSFADDELCFFVNKGKNRNNYDKKIIKKHQRHEDRAINVFAMPHHPDSVASVTYRPSKAGIALGTAVKISGILQHDVKKMWQIAPLYNHEIGHVVGLRHSWYKNDGCDDTPPNNNCYSATKEGKCVGPTSNNMMDYNNMQMALTPCQIGIATKYMHNIKAKVRPMLEKDWCDYNPEKTLIISQDSIHFNRHADLKGDIIVKRGSKLKISCRVHMPRRGKIIVEPGATLILNGCRIHNDCGESWGGIELQKEGSNEATLIQQGEVVLENLDSI